MNCPDQSQWTLLSMNLLSDGEAEALRLHALTCPACRDGLRQVKQNHALLQRTYEVFEQNHDQRREQMMAALPDSATACEKTPHTVRLGDSRMKKSTGIKMALALVPAACIAIAFIAPMFGSPTVALADTIKKINAVQSFVCKKTTELASAEEPSVYAVDAKSPAVTLTCLNSDNGPFYHQTDGNTYVSIKTDRELAVILEGVLAYKYTYKDTDQQVSDTVMDFIEKFRSLDKVTAKNLGNRTIDGQEAVGFAVTGTTFGGSTCAPQIWVDATTNLPIEIVLEFSTTGKKTHNTRYVLNNFQWNVDIDPSLFEIPDQEPMTTTDKPIAY